MPGILESGLLARHQHPKHYFTTSVTLEFYGLGLGHGDRVC